MGTLGNHQGEKSLSGSAAEIQGQCHQCKIRERQLEQSKKGENLTLLLTLLLCHKTLPAMYKSRASVRAVTKKQWALSLNC